MTIGAAATLDPLISSHETTQRKDSIMVLTRRTSAARVMLEGFRRRAVRTTYETKNYIKIHRKNTQEDQEADDSKAPGSATNSKSNKQSKAEAEDEQNRKAKEEDRGLRFKDFSGARTPGLREGARRLLR